MRYIQTVVSDEEHSKLVHFAANCNPPITLGDLLRKAVIEMIEYRESKKEQSSN